MKMLRRFYVFFLCSFICVHGHPLDSNEERTASENIEIANKDLVDFTEGDMAIPQGAALKKGYDQWPNGIVPYTLSSSFSSSEKTKIRDALKDVMRAAPCLSFQEKSRPTAPNDYVEVIKGGGCWSMVGRIRGKQKLSLGRDCVTSGTIIHEFLHAIGFYHEQSRPDRDQYVRVIEKNIDRVCGDKSSVCIAVGRRCSKYTKLLCPLSCKVCTGSKSEMCMNLKDAKDDCKSRAAANECQIRSISKRWNMKKECTKTCCERGELYKYPQT